MSKILKILENFNTEAKLEFIRIQNSSELTDKMRCETLNTTLRKQAETVLQGKCPHERSQIDTNIVTISPRNWMTYREEVTVYGPCKFCGDK